MNDFLRLYKKYGFDYAFILQPYIIEYIMAGHLYSISSEGYSVYSGKLFFVGATCRVNKEAKRLKKELQGGWELQHPLKWSKGKIVAYGEVKRAKNEKRLIMTGLGWIESPVKTYLRKGGSILDVIHWKKIETV